MTSTIIQLVPCQQKLGMKIAVAGTGLPKHLPHIRIRDFWKFWQKPTGADYRVWHARRNTEMLPGIIMRDILRMKLKLVFTSASQRQHTSYTKWLISKMDHVIATSHKTARYLEVPNSVVMHGIDLERFAPAKNKDALKNELGLDSGQRFVGCFGRIRRQKGTDLFIETMLATLPDYPSWSAIIAGRATEKHIPFEKELKKKVADAGLTDRILFVGEHKDIEKWYQVLDLYIAPQRWEGFGLTPLEAAACGVSTIASDVGAFCELIIENKTGAVIEPDNLPKMVLSTQNALSKPERTQKTGQQARQHMETYFSLEREARALNHYYRKLGNQ